MILSRSKVLLLALVASAAVLPAQTLYTPGGTLGPVTNSSTNVGIGTTSPTYRLSVEATSTGLAFRAHSPGDFVFALAGDGRAGTNLDLFSIRNADTGVVYLNTVNNARMAFGVSAGSSAGSLVETMTISPSGSVGIGTTMPAQKLSVVGDISTTTYLYTSNISSYSGNLTISSGSTSNAIVMGIGSAENMRISTAGNVGIGTTNPTQKLSVNGTVRAKEVIVDTGWSDYVFADSFKLKALSETEAFIKAEKHLPGIPSAQEVAEHGISVGEMQAKLLAKIEELTLHQIEQAKQISAVRAENAVLRRKVESLEQSREPNP